MGAVKLKQRVFDAGICASCGACAGLCPYIKVVEDRVVMIEPCTLDSGRCYDVCPRTGFSHEELVHEYFPLSEKHQPIGPYSKVYLSRSTDPELSGAGQYGSTVSALAEAALQMQLVEGLVGVRAKRGENGLPEPEPAWLTDRPSIIDAAGSKYQPVPSLALFNRLIEDGEIDKVGVIGRPCQVTALRRRQKLFEPQIGKLKLIIGLFCMWALDFRKLSEIVAKEAGPGPVEKFDVPQGRSVVYRDGNKIELPYEQVRQLARNSCAYCYDFTSELADLSVGATEFDDSRNTLIVRSNRGAELVEFAADRKLIELEPFPEDKLELLFRASLDKKRRVLAACDSYKGDPPIRVSAAEYNSVMGGGK